MGIFKLDRFEFEWKSKLDNQVKDELTNTVIM